MASKRGKNTSGKPKPTRTTATLPSDIYQTLQDIAKQKKVSVSWVIREAAEKYVADQWPLLK